MKTHHLLLPNLSFDFLPIEGGHFYMGDEHGDLWEDSRPIHPVAISDFYLAKFPVTQALWKAVMNGENPSRFQDDDRPVEQVSWDDAQAFIKKLNRQTEASRPTGHAYRLPTEAEWEYAARGGKYHTEGYKYAGSDRLKDVGWCEDNSDNETKPVGSKYANQLGLHDMSGNVWEWCEDWFGGSEYYEKCKQMGMMKNPQGPNKGTNRVMRGGGWFFTLQDCRVAFRYNGTPGHRDRSIGFRLVLALQSVG